MRWTKAQFVVFSPQVTVRAITVQDKPRAERDRLLQVKREQRILTEAEIQRTARSNQADRTREAPISNQINGDR
jgi:hypothetical protein